MPAWLQVGFKMFLGISVDVTNWNQDNTAFSLHLYDNPLTGKARCGISLDHEGRFTGDSKYPGPWASSFTLISYPTGTYRFSALPIETLQALLSETISAHTIFQSSWSSQRNTPTSYTPICYVESSGELWKWYVRQQCCLPYTTIWI